MECGMVSFYTNEWEDHSNTLEPPSLWSLDGALELGTWGFPGGSDSKVFACNAEDPGSIPESGRSPGEGNGRKPTPVFLPGKFHGQRSLVGYSPWGCKESDTTGGLSLHLELGIPSS